MFSAQIEEKATLNNLPAGVHVQGGFVLDEGIKAVVTKLVPITARHFCINDVGLFRAVLKQTDNLWVLVQRHREVWDTSKFIPAKVHEVGQPEHRRVAQIDGRVLVLETPLNFTPMEGAVVQRIRAMDYKYAREEDLDKQEKALKAKGEKYRWL